MLSKVTEFFICMLPSAAPVSWRTLLVLSLVIQLLWTAPSGRAIERNSRFSYDFHLCHLVVLSRVSRTSCSVTQSQAKHIMYVGWMENIVVASTLVQIQRPASWPFWKSRHSLLFPFRSHTHWLIPADSIDFSLTGLQFTVYVLSKTPIFPAGVYYHVYFHCLGFRYLN